MSQVFQAWTQPRRWRLRLGYDLTEIKLTKQRGSPMKTRVSTRRKRRSIARNRQDVSSKQEKTPKKKQGERAPHLWLRFAG